MKNNKILNDNRKGMFLTRAPIDPLNVTALVYNLSEELALSFTVDHAFDRQWHWNGPWFDPRLQQPQKRLIAQGYLCNIVNKSCTLPCILYKVYIYPLLFCRVI